MINYNLTELLLNNGDCVAKTGTLSNVIVGVLVDHPLQDLGRLEQLPVDDGVLVDLPLAQKLLDRVVRVVLLAPAGVDLEPLMS